MKKIGRKAIPSMWVFQCKLYTDGLIQKLKAQLCVHRDKQVHGVDFSKSYALVVHWTTIQLILIISIILNWTTVQMDYTNAFAQAPLEEDIYMEIPRDFIAADVDNKDVLKMNNSLYSLRQAPLSWFEHLKKHLESQGFVASSVNQCLLVNKKTKMFLLILTATPLTVIRRLRLPSSNPSHCHTK